VLELLNFPALLPSTNARPPAARRAMTIAAAKPIHMARMTQLLGCFADNNTMDLNLAEAAGAV
jgi:hypothetical protein